MSQIPVLVVHAEDTLFRSPARLEAFWRLAAREPARVLAPRKSRKTAIAQEVAALAADDPLPPMNEDALAAMRARRAAGGRVILVSDFSQAFAESLRERLGCVDEAFGAETMAGGVEAFLTRSFGAQGFERLPAKAAPAPELRMYLREARTYQWSKNVLVFLPVLTAHDFSFAAWIAAVMAFVAFSLVASSVYVFNDLLDLGADRAHPRKRNRPLASGAIPLDRGSYLAAGLGLAGLGAAAAGGVALFSVLIAYVLLTTAYSTRLKREPVIDICVLAGLYTIRIVAGAAATGLSLSVWLLAFSMFIFLSLAAIKRQAELVDSRSGGRDQPAGRGYRISDLAVIETMAIAAGYVAVLVLALYLNTPTVQALYGAPEFLWGVCVILLYWISRAAMIAHRGEMDDDPIIFALRDRVSQICGVLVLATTLAATLA